ncbi:unnamed protein product [Notodromas monacha]|uniref:Peptidase S1 domain-containing protein n=1 Tax=Notodromas monacha TaxID=399045 RepID=A0A7R9GGP9_9CRUS|nr:unnamed protein product [Notodromas monacha]CAG0920440.1 unnamed protein product [Notodromas monacha]
MKLFVAALLVVAATATPVFRRPRLVDRRVVGGEDAEPGQFPHQVTFQYYGSHLCGGSVLDENTVITAAHCCDIFSDPSGASIIAGNHLLEGSDSTEQAIDVADIIINADFGFDLSNDICLLKLAEPLELNDAVQPIALPGDREEPEEGDILIASGWGTTSSGGNLPEVLQWVRVPYVNDNVCDNLNGGVAESMICAGNVEDGGVDTCQGDSGGPLTDEAVSKLLGLTSWGYGCAQPGYPGVYTQVSYFLDWIAENSK